MTSHHRTEHLELKFSRTPFLPRVPATTTGGGGGGDPSPLLLPPNQKSNCRDRESNSGKREREKNPSLGPPCRPLCVDPARFLPARPPDFTAEGEKGEKVTQTPTKHTRAHALALTSVLCLQYVSLAPPKKRNGFFSCAQKVGPFFFCALEWVCNACSDSLTFSVRCSVHSTQHAHI